MSGRSLRIRVRVQSSTHTMAINVIIIPDKTSAVVTDIHSRLQLSHSTLVYLHPPVSITLGITDKIMETTIKGEEDTKITTIAKGSSKDLVRALPQSKI